MSPAAPQQISVLRRPARLVRRIAGRVIRLFLLAPLVLPLASISSSAQTRPSNGDTQNWNELQITVPLNKKVDLIFSGSIRFGRNLSDFVDERGGASISFKLGKYFTLAPGYLYRDDRRIPGQSVSEQRALLVGTVRLPLGSFTLSDRNQLERRFRTPANFTIYRNRLQIEHPVELMDVDLRLFASDEVFYDTRVDAWVRNRFTVGGNRALNKQLTLELYYMRQNDGRTRPGDLHVIGTAFRVRL